MERSRTEGSVLPAIGLTSLAVMMLEVGLTRALSVVHDYHYAFLLLSLAVLGLGLGGALALRLGPQLRSGAWGDLGGLAGALLVLALVRIPGGTSLPMVVLLGLVAFTGAGTFLASAFTRGANRSEGLYAADLAGAGLGAMLVVPALRLGAPTVILMGAAGLGAGSWLGAPRGDRRRQAVLTTGLVALLAVHCATGWPGRLRFHPGAAKPEQAMLDSPHWQGEIQEVAWSHFGRSDLVVNRALPGVKTLFVDGGAAADLFRAGENPAVRSLVQDFIGTRALQALSPGDPALLIGPGGGRDVRVCREVGLRELTSVELNPDVVDLVRRAEPFAGPIYRVDGNRGSRLVLDEGRSYLRRSRQRYGLIFMAVPVTASSRSPDGYALSESFLFTVESMGEYLAHLHPEGWLLVVAHHDAEAVRLLRTGRMALLRQGLAHEEAMSRMAIVGSATFPAFLLSPGPIPPEIAHALRRVHTASPPPLSSAGWCGGPLLGADGRAGQAARALARLGSGEAGSRELRQALRMETSPVTDDRPFFFKFIPGTPWVVSILLLVAAGMAALLLWIGRPTGDPARARWIAAALGAAFMLVEIPLIQRFGLFLGRPVYALVVVLAALLLGAGLGSRIGASLPLSPARRGAWAAGGAGLVALLAAFGLAPLLHAALGWPLPARIALAGGLALGMGGLLGIPFPSTLRWIDQQGRSDTVPLLWAVNGVTALLGSCLAIAGAIHLGFTAAFVLGAACYGAVAGLLGTAKQ